jgi:hypothetical protein
MQSGKPVSMLVKVVRYKGQDLGQGFPPVRPVMTSVAYPEFMGDLFLPHGNVDEGIAFVKKIVVPAIDIPADRSQFFRREFVHQCKRTVPPEIGLLLFL